MAGVFGSSPAPAAAATCRGEVGLANHLELAGGGKITTRRVKCEEARTLPGRFAERCVAAYTSQGTCRIAARRRWRCASRIAGSVLDGAPSSIQCRARRARVRFTVRLSMDAIHRPATATAAQDDTGPGAPWQDDQACVDTNASGEVAPPPGLPHTFAIHAYGTVPLVVAEGVQSLLVSRRVAPRLTAGLGANPLSNPRLHPVFLRTGHGGGITGSVCSGPPGEGSVVAIGDSLREAALITAHELFHAHASGVRDVPDYPWFEDPAADWSVWKAGLLDPPTTFEVFLQYPNRALDTLVPEGYRYGLWRFVQFLDDKGLVVGPGGSWPLIRASVAAKPAMSEGLNQFLVARGSSLGEEAAAFWGEHIKRKPRRPPRIVPSAHNSNRIEITAGRHTYSPTAGPLHTKLTDFKLAPGVRRVEFEFEPPADGYFWGLVAPNESRRFRTGDTVSFCVGQAHEDDLKWPGHFPVTFTNGLLATNTLVGTVNVYAQTEAEHCGGPPNRACTVLREAGAVGLLGPDLPDIGGFAGSAGVEGGRPYQQCLYKGVRGLGYLQLQRWPSSKQLRGWLRRKSTVPGWRPLRLGDGGVILESPGGGNHVFVQVALGRTRLSVEVTANTGATSKALRIANAAVSRVR